MDVSRDLVNTWILPSDCEQMRSHDFLDFRHLLFHFEICFMFRQERHILYYKHVRSDLVRSTAVQFEEVVIWIDPVCGFAKQRQEYAPYLSPLEKSDIT